jgi:hypothetical protein
MRDAHTHLLRLTRDPTGVTGKDLARVCPHQKLDGEVFYGMGQQGSDDAVSKGGGFTLSLYPGAALRVFAGVFSQIGVVVEQEYSKLRAHYRLCTENGNVCPGGALVAAAAEDL